ncbi:OsmC family protein [Sulfuritalea sp.]|uniref:OsmC family protein n=1 Tax=Sulfuritalea sp. TaxID=2480090 RepID=UPI001AC31A06|nr:OsmC family protein [Sulfuritalea sp.]MBN8474332.1 OsmC family protein [Sulfuritalea sp.]
MSLAKQHLYTTRTEWTGNLGEGTAGYRAYSRDHGISAVAKPEIPGSSDPAFRGDATRWNPEDLLVASLSSCHMLWYLHLCSQAKIVVLAYRDDAVGTMVEDASGGGRFSHALLRPVATLAAGSDAKRARALHGEAHRLCFIANSVNFPVVIESTELVAD